MTQRKRTAEKGLNTMATTHYFDTAQARTVLRAVRREFNRIVANDESLAGPGWVDPRRCHPSHVIAQALETIAKRYDIGYGVEGACSSDIHGAGLQYINMGDPYELTIVATTQPGATVFSGVRFQLACWGDFAENPRTARKYGLDK